MGRVASFLLAVLAVTTLGAPQGEPSAVVGKVLSPDGKPVSGAKVWLVVNRWEVGKPTVESSAVTDTQGNFRLPFRPPLRVYSAYTIAFHPNFAVGWQSFDPRDLKPLTVRLNRPAPLAGIVITPEGKALANAKIQVWSVESISPRLAFEVGKIEFGISDIPEEVTPFWTVADENGRFVLNNLPAEADVRLIAHHPDFAPSKLPHPERSFLLRTGTVDIVLVMEPKGILSGQVLRDGKPVAGAQVVCQPRFYGQPDKRITANEDGKFEVVLTSGQWRVWAVAEDGQWQSETQLIRIVPGAKFSLTLELLKAVEVRGVVRDGETKNPVPFAEVNAYREIRDEEGFQDWLRADPVKANEQGEFQLFLLPGKWSLNAWASYAPDHFASDRKGVELISDKPTEVEFLLKPPQKLLVQVVDEKGKPVPNAIVTNEWRTVQADKNGQALLDPIVRPVWAATPDLKMFGQTEVKPEDKSVRIVVRKGVPVSGVVVDENGKPIPNARLRVTAVRSDPNAPPGIEIPYDWFEFNADERGRFQLHLPSGQKFVLTAFVPDFFPTQTEPFVPDKPVNLTVKMKRPNLTITGTVVDAETGKPIWGAAVVTWLPIGSMLSPTPSIIAFTDQQGQFRLTGLHREHPARLEVRHPFYELFELPTSEALPQTIRLERIRPKLSVQLAVGKPAPPLSDVQWLDGDAPSLTGKETHLLFAMPFDPSCERTIQRLKELQAKSPEKIQVIVVFDATLPAEDLKGYVRELGLPFRFGTVPEGRRSGWDSETFQRYGVKSVPMLVVIDEQGIVKAINPE
jgi:uncharacterized GH25 family protein